MSSVSINHLSKKFGKQVIFDDVSLTLPDCGFIAILGDSGSGKSTLLELLSGIDCNYSGSIKVLGKELKLMSEEDRCAFRLTNLGFLRQSYDLVDLETVEANIHLPLLGEKGEREFRKRQGEDIMKSLGLLEKRKRIANTLSGGEKQRVALARALMNDPKILLCDEPTGALDKENAKLVFSSLSYIAKEKLVILVSHDEENCLKYSDAVLRLHDGKLSGVLVDNSDSEKNAIVYPSAPAKKESNVPIYKWIPHALHITKAKKWRSLLSFLVLTFALSALGLSLYVERDLKSQLNQAFSSLTGEGTIVAERKETTNTYTNVYASSEETIADMAVDYPNLIRDYGVSYLADFSSYFPDSELAFTISKSGLSTQIPSLGIRAINDYLWLDEEKSTIFYPSAPPVLEDDHVVLGLPYTSMALVCRNLGIVGTYESLGEYVSTGELFLLFRFQNDNWTYYDEQILTIDAVCQTKVPTLYHYEHKWNEYMLEDRMRFPYSDVEDESLPWILQKVFYVVPRETRTSFIEDTRLHPYFDRFIFERASSDYNATQCEKNMPSDLNRFYVYEGNKKVLSYQNLRNIASKNYFSSYGVYGEGSYKQYSEAMAVGFANNFYLSANEDSLIEATDAYAICKEEDADKELALPSGVIVGSVMKPRTSALTLSFDFSNLMSGSSPSSIEEACLSKGLYEKLGKPQTVYLSAQASSFVSSGYLYRDYRYGELKVTGVIEEDLDILYVSSYWPIDYFRDILGVSSFMLEPRQAVFHLKGNQNSEQIVESLSKEYEDYRFTDPSLKVSNSIASVISYVDIILRVCTVLALTSSLLLLLVVAFLTVKENERESKMMFIMGFKRDEIVDSHGVYLTLMILYATVSSSVLLMFLEKVVDEIIKQNFSATGSFSWDFIPLGAIWLSSIIGLAIIILLLKRWISKLSFLREG